MATKNDVITSEKLKVSGRAAFLRLDKPKAFEEGQEPRYEGTCLVDPSTEAGKKEIKELLSAAADISKKKWGFVAKAIKLKAAALGMAKRDEVEKLKDDGIKFDAFYDGNTKDYDGYKDRWVLAMHNKNKPAVANRKGDTVDPTEEQYPYSGSFDRFSYTLWTQDNKYGKRIGVNLRGVQFMRDGEKFGAGSIDAKDEFDALEEADAPAGDEDSPFGND